MKRDCRILWLFFYFFVSVCLVWIILFNNLEMERNALFAPFYSLTGIFLCFLTFNRIDLFVGKTGKYSTCLCSAEYLEIGSCTRCFFLVVEIYEFVNEFWLFFFQNDIDSFNHIWYLYILTGPWQGFYFPSILVIPVDSLSYLVSRTMVITKVQIE